MVWKGGEEECFVVPRLNVKFTENSRITVIKNIDQKWDHSGINSGPNPSNSLYHQ